MELTDKLRSEYAQRFATCILNPSRKVETAQIIARFIRGRERYDTVSAVTSVPWFIIAVIHDMECSNRFDCHLHNGDPLDRRTVQDPKGRPPDGTPPFSWEASAEDALRYEHFDAWTDWTVVGTLYKLELYNGPGYRNKGVSDPYLWGASQFYQNGKFIKDHFFDRHAVSDQIGAAVILRQLSDAGVIEFQAPPDTISRCEP